MTTRQLPWKLRWQYYLLPFLVGWLTGLAHCASCSSSLP